MQREFHVYEPSRGHGLAHDPFNSIVGPRPIGWIASQAKDGRRNLAPYSFFNAFNYRPPIVGFASIGYKDSVRNIEETGEFAWNLATLPLAERMNRTSAPVAREVDEFELAGLEAAPSLRINVPRVADSPVSFECRLSQLLRLTDADGGPTESWMVFGEVVTVHIDKAMIVDGSYRTTLAEPILRGGGPGDFFKVLEENRFVMLRPGL